MSLLNTNIGPERVQVFPVPIGTVQLPGVATSVTAFLISTNLVGAPLNTPTSVFDFPTFTSLFGNADNIQFDGYYAVQGFFDNAGTGNTAIIVNVGASPSAADFIGNASLGTGLRALDNVDVLGLVCAPGLPLSMKYLVDPAVIDYAKTVRAEFGATLSTTFSLTSIPKEISQAQTEETLVTSSFVSSSGSGPYVIQLPTTSAQPEIQTITCVADVSGSLAGTYFTLNSAHDTDKYVVWYRVSGAGSNPNVPGKIAVEVNISTNDTANTVASSTAAALNLISDFTASPSGANVQVTNTANGPCTAAADGGIPTGFGFAVNQVGNDGSVNLSAVTAGMLVENHDSSFEGVISAVNNGAKQVTVITNPAGHFSNPALFIRIPSAISYKDVVVNDPSKSEGWYYNPLVVIDASASAMPGQLVDVDPVGHVAGVMARIDSNTSIGGVSHAPAGIQYASIAGIQGLALSISERIDAGPLRLAFINRITSFPGSGNVVFGAYTDAPSGSTAEEQLIQVIRSIQFIKGSLERGLRGFLWENFSPRTQEQIQRAIESFLRSNSYLFPAGLPESQQFQVVSITPTQDELDQGLLKVRVLVKPNTAVRFIEISLEFPLPTA